MSEGPATPASTPPDEMSLTEKARFYGGIAVVAILVVFFLQNLQEAEVRFLWFEWETRVIWALVVSAVFGALATFSVLTIRSRAARRKAQEAQQQMENQ